MVVIMKRPHAKHCRGVALPQTALVNISNYAEGWFYPIVACFNFTLLRKLFCVIDPIFHWSNGKDNFSIPLMKHKMGHCFYHLCILWMKEGQSDICMFCSSLATLFSFFGWYLEKDLDEMSFYPLAGRGIALLHYVVRDHFTTFSMLRHERAEKKLENVFYWSFYCIDYSHCFEVSYGLHLSINFRVIPL